jgi:hypothetical protein
VSRIGVSIGVANSKLGSYSFSGAATITDPIAGFVSGGASVATLNTLLATSLSDLDTANTAAITYGAAFDTMMTTATNGLVALLNLTAGGTVAYNSTTKQLSGAPAASAPTWTTGLQTAFIALFNTMGADIVTAVANLATANGDTYALGPTPAAVTLLATALADVKLIATTATNGLVAVLSNQTFTSATCQLSGVPSGSVTPTQTVQEALMVLCNTAGTAIVAANAAIAAIRVNTNAVSVPLAAAVAATGGASGSSNDVVVSIDIAKAPTVSVVEIAFLHLLRALRGSSYLQP